MRKALEWKPWYHREVEPPPAVPLEDPVKQMIEQAIRLEEAKEFLLKIDGQGYQKAHEEYFEKIYLTLDEDNRAELKAFRSDLHQDRLKALERSKEMTKI
jgi:predicted solute-binding protein